MGVKDDHGGFQELQAQAVAALRDAATQRLGGTLELHREKGPAAVIMVEQGRVYGVRTRNVRRDPLILALFRSGTLDVGQFNEATSSAKAAGQKPEEWLLEEGLVERDDLEAAQSFRDLEDLVEALMADMTQVKVKLGATEESQLTASASGLEGFCPLELVAEVEKRCAEWQELKRYLPHDDDVPRPAKVVTDNIRQRFEALDELAQSLGRRADGQTMARELITTAPATVHVARCALAVGLKSGMLERLPPRRLVKLAHAYETAKKFDKSLRLYELARRRGGEKIDVLELAIRVSRCYERLGDQQEARNSYVETAHALRDAGRSEAAANTLRRAIRIGERHLGLQARLASWLVEDGELAEARDEVLELVEGDLADDSYVARAISQAVKLYLDRAPDDQPVREAARGYLASE